jgi:hypothetical protein
LLKSIPYFEDYLIDDVGNIFSTKNNKWLSTPIHKTTGYRVVTLYNAGGQKFILVHRALAAANNLIDLLDSTAEVDHINGDKLDNRIGNYQILDKKSHKIKTDLSRGLCIEKNYCLDCGKLLKNKSSIRCRECHTSFTQKENKTNNITAEEIEFLVREYS